jgi:hypothetical protein
VSPILLRCSAPHPGVVAAPPSHGEAIECAWQRQPLRCGVGFAHFEMHHGCLTACSDSLSDGVLDNNGVADAGVLGVGLVAPAIAVPSGARWEGQGRVRGERSERTLDAPKRSRKMFGRSDWVFPVRSLRSL